jgi:hypothetical protein
MDHLRGIVEAVVAMRTTESTVDVTEAAIKVIRCILIDTVGQLRDRSADPVAELGLLSDKFNGVLVEFNNLVVEAALPDSNSAA